jgi:diguanylate cyclase (GGDEF)-like protein/PAS domain S-box-containing protein
MHSQEASPVTPALALCRGRLELKSAILDGMGDGIIAHTLDGTIVYANHQAAELLGYQTVEDLTRIDAWSWLHHDSLNALPLRLSHLRTHGTAVYESQCVNRETGLVSVECHARLVNIDPWGDLVICAKRDISPRWESQERMRQLAFFDPLTGLANRALLENRLGSALAAAQETDGLVGVIYMDLDDFKPVNDTHGHSVGDRVLQILAERMVNCVRDTDTIARVGGDEFVALFPDITEEDDLRAKARVMADCIKSPIALDGRAIRVSVSVGLAIYRQGEHHSDLICRADHAMYRAKSQGHAGWEELAAF